MGKRSRTPVTPATPRRQSKRLAAQRLQSKSLEPVLENPPQTRNDIPESFTISPQKGYAVNETQHSKKTSENTAPLRSLSPNLVGFPEDSPKENQENTDAVSHQDNIPEQAAEPLKANQKHAQEKVKDATEIHLEKEEEEPEITKSENPSITINAVTESRSTQHNWHSTPSLLAATPVDLFSFEPRRMSSRMTQTKAEWAIPEGYVNEDAYNRLKRLYTNLRELRTTEEEKLYNDLKRSSEEREKASEEMIAQLREEVAKAQGERELVRADCQALRALLENRAGESDQQALAITELQAQLADHNDLVVELGHAKNTVETLETTIAQMKDDHAVLVSRLENAQFELESLSRSAAGEVTDNVMLEFYRRLTGVAVDTQSRHDRFRCYLDVPHRQRKISFEIAFCNLEEVSYSPVIIDTGNYELPDYLVEEIYFSREDLPSFLSKLLSIMHKK